MPEIFRRGFNCVIKRAIIIGNGFSGSENQSIGLIRALGLSNNHSLYRVTRPIGGVNKWFHWLPVSLHKKLDYMIKLIFGVSRSQLISRGKKLTPLLVGKSGLSDILEADANQIATMARETFERDGPLLVVASGRDTITVASSIKRLAPESIFVVQLQHPRSHLNRFDLVITPHHDYYPLTPHAQAQIPWILRRWITPSEPPENHVDIAIMVRTS